MSTPLQQIAELLIQQSLSGLSQQEQQQLQRLRIENNVSESDLRDEMEKIELAAAAADLASFENQSAEIPEHVKDSVLVEAGKFFESRSTNAPASGSIPSSVLTPASSSSNGWMIATLIATAACILLLLNPVINNPIEKPVAMLMKSFVASGPSDLIDVEMVAGFDATGKEISSGRLVWSDQLQEGYMEFAGLKINDPKTEQYQLWIFESPTQKFPIDGGVFDITKDQQVIKIDPKIATSAMLFAVTVEKPGGVVVSDRKRIASADPVLANAVAQALAKEEAAKASGQK